MTDILASRIQNATLTKKQQKIAQYLIQHQAELGSKSSKDLADEIGVSDVSIIRFCRAIGYAGYAELKSEVYSTLVEDASGLSLSERMAASTRQFSNDSVHGSFVTQAQNAIARSFLANKEAEYENIAQKLISADRRFIIGLRGCKGIAVQFSRLLSFMVNNVIPIIDDECITFSLMQSITPGDVVMMFVYSRYYKVDISYLTEAKKRGAYFCIVTDTAVNPLSRYADTTLLVNTDHMSFFHSVVGASAIGEYILTLISRQVDFNEHLKSRDAFTAERRLDPNDTVVH